MAASDLARYVVKQKVREIGGYLAVFAAHQRMLERDVELRVLQTLVDESSEMYAKFQAECRALAGLDHPGILKVLDLGHAGDRVFYVTDPPPGLPLREYLAQGQAPPDVAIEVGVQLGQALEHLHARGLVHRGLSLGGVNYDLVSGRVVICDFSLLKSSSFNVPSLRDVVDADSFEALPERAYNWPIDARSDIFLTGALMYALVTGVDPLSAQVLARTVDYQFTAPVARNPDCPAELERFLMRALARQPDERFQTAADFVKELEAVRRKLLVKKASRGLPPVAATGMHPVALAPSTSEPPAQVALTSAAPRTEARAAAAAEPSCGRDPDELASVPPLKLLAGAVLTITLLALIKLSSSSEAPVAPTAPSTPVASGTTSGDSGKVTFRPGTASPATELPSDSRPESGPSDSFGGAPAAAVDSAGRPQPLVPGDIRSLVDAAKAEPTSPKTFNARWDALRAWADELPSKPGSLPPISPMELTTVRLKIYREPRDACLDLDEMISKAAEAVGVARSEE